MYRKALLYLGVLGLCGLVEADTPQKLADIEITNKVYTAQETDTAIANAVGAISGIPNRITNATDAIWADRRFTTLDPHGAWVVEECNLIWNGTDTWTYRNEESGIGYDISYNSNDGEWQLLVKELVDDTWYETDSGTDYGSSDATHLTFQTLVGVTYNATRIAHSMTSTLALSSDVSSVRDALLGYLPATGGVINATSGNETKLTIGNFDGNNKTAILELNGAPGYTYIKLEAPGGTDDASQIRIGGNGNSIGRIILGGRNESIGQDVMLYGRDSGDIATVQNIADMTNSTVVQIGTGATVLPTNNVVGLHRGIAIGYRAISTGESLDTNAQTVAIGAHSEALGEASVAIGSQSSTTGKLSVAVGYNASSTNEKAIAIGPLAKALGANSIAIGPPQSSTPASAQGGESIAIGRKATASGWTDIAIGCDTKTGSSTDARGRAIAIGRSAQALRLRSIAFGDLALAEGTNSVQLGYGTNSVHNSFKVGSYMMMTNGIIPSERVVVIPIVSAALSAEQYSYSDWTITASTPGITIEWDASVLGWAPMYNGERCGAYTGAVDSLSLIWGEGGAPAEYDITAVRSRVENEVLRVPGYAIIGDLSPLTISNSVRLLLHSFYGSDFYTSWSVVVPEGAPQSVTIEWNGSSWVPMYDGDSLGAPKGNAESISLVWTATEASFPITATRSIKTSLDIPYATISNGLSTVLSGYATHQQAINAAKAVVGPATNEVMQAALRAVASHTHSNIVDAVGNRIRADRSVLIHNKDYMGTWVNQSTGRTYTWDPNPNFIGPDGMSGGWVNYTDGYGIGYDSGSWYIHEWWSGEGWSSPQDSASGDENAMSIMFYSFGDGWTFTRNSLPGSEWQQSKLATTNDVQDSADMVLGVVSTGIVHRANSVGTETYWQDYTGIVWRTTLPGLYLSIPSMGYDHIFTDLGGDSQFEEHRWEIAGGVPGIGTVSVGYHDSAGYWIYVNDSMLDENPNDYLPLTQQYNGIDLTIDMRSAATNIVGRMALTNDIPAMVAALPKPMANKSITLSDAQSLYFAISNIVEALGGTINLPPFQQ